MRTEISYAEGRVIFFPTTFYGKAKEGKAEDEKEEEPPLSAPSV